MSSVDRQTVFVVDDDEAVRRALSLLLRSMSLPVECFGSAGEFFARLDEKCTGCVVLDIRMPEMSGLEVQEMMREMACSLPVIFITGHGNVQMAVRAMRHGAIDFLEKPFDDQALLDRINQALAIDRERRELQTAKARLDSLTPREREVMNRVVTGSANKQIAAELGVSERTVEIHRARVMTKAGVSSLAELVATVTKLRTPMW